MSTRRNIQGPHSALTDFLASHNISAAEIRDNYLQRVRDTQPQQNGDSSAHQNAEAAATARQQSTQNGGGEEEDDDDDDDDDDEEVNAVVARTRSGRKRKSRAAQEKAKAAKKKKQTRAARRRGGDDDGDVSDSDEEFLLRKKPAVPGQLSNCEICDKRFTVTPYSKTGPGGGLLCTACSKELVAEEKKKEKTKAKKPARKGRRQNFSNILDGIAQTGALSLLEMCVKRVADNINNIEEFGDLPEKLLHRLSQILSKRRELTSRTLDLFLRRDFKFIEIFDCAKLEEEDFEKIFALMPYLTKVDFRCAGQMKDAALEYVSDRECHINYLHLDACNLISDERWQKFFEACGANLEVLKLSNLDCTMGDETVAHMVEHCPNLWSLKLEDCWKPGNESLKSIAKLEKLEHLSLGGPQFQQAGPDIVEHLLQNVGKNLRTLSLRSFKHADDGVLETIHQQCAHLSKLRLSDNVNYTDKAIANLFTDWQNPGLNIVDFSGTRHLDNTKPEGREEEPMGLASAAFKALMAHSGSTVQKLNISSCRHVSFDAISDVFDGQQQKVDKTYPCLEELDISFHTRVDDFLVGRVFRCCPALKKVIAFACFQVRDVKVPAGVALIGGVNAHRSIGQEEG